MAYTEFMIGSPEEGAEIKVTVTEDGSGNLQFDLELISGTADMNGLFFDLADYNVDEESGEESGVDVDSTTFHATETITVEEETVPVGEMELQSAEGDVSNLGGGINVNGEIVKTYGEFDVGVVLDETGLGNSDDVQSISFLLDADQDLSLADIMYQDFALRLTSVDEDGSRDGSLKLVGSPTEIMEDPEDPGFPPEEPEGPLEPEQPEGVVDSTDGTTTDGETTTGEDPTTVEDPATGEDPTTGEDTTTGEDPTTGEDTTTSEDPATGGDPILTDPLMDELFNFQKDETGGDTDGNVLANDDTSLTIVSVTNSAGETFDVVESGTTISGTEGGSLTVYPDGTVDFDAGEDFGSLYEGESSDVVFSYTTDSDQTGTLTVTVDGAGAPDDGGDIPLLPPIEEEGTDTTLDPNLDSGTGDPLLEEDFILG